jgi:hypothetical protein
VIWVVTEHWWNGSWGTMTRRDVWLETSEHEVIRVRWRGGDWRDRDGVFHTTNPTVAINVLVELMGESPADNGWRRLTVALPDA